ncbi:MAG: GIY-YIG nuclease family protein [Lewinellaceae bacterium]|nr:GIY-YIG nuclease family protein [Lewinellaceae bacterium]
MKTHLYYVYILTNVGRTVLYIGVTNNLKRRLLEHVSGKNAGNGAFTSRYNCHHLVYYELFEDIQDAINRETTLKKWSRAKKEHLIGQRNPNWTFLNDTIQSD